jgi:hypothetical protein
MKTCSKCGGEPKPLSEFYACFSMRDGRLNQCKECVKTRVKNARRNPVLREHIRAYDRVRCFLDGRRRQVLEGQRKHRAKYPDKYKARNLVNNALRDGVIHRKPCEVCGDHDSEAHHYDYSKPLDVHWLCFKHHREWKHGQIVGPILVAILLAFTMPTHPPRARLAFTMPTHPPQSATC